MSNTVFRIAIFASGGGSNAEAIFQHFKNHTQISVVLVVSNRHEAFVLQRAAKAGVATRVFEREVFREATGVIQELKEKKITHIVLAGFLLLMPEKIIREYPERIINIHPALLPRFGGKGMYGMKVHEAVKSAGETKTGITIHLVNECYDEGRIIFQQTCAIDKTSSPESIAASVQALEHEHYPRVIEKWILGHYDSQEA